MFRKVPLSITRSFSLYTQQWYMSYRFVDSLRAGSGRNCSSIIRSFSLYTQQWCMSYRFADRLRAGSGRNCSSILILLASSQQACMTYTITVCTVKNSWWWTEEQSETCRVSFQNKCEKLVHLVGFIARICHDAGSHERKDTARCLHWTATFFRWTFKMLVTMKTHVMM